jgi:uncharacterized membrane protein YeiH
LNEATATFEARTTLPTFMNNRITRFDLIAMCFGAVLGAALAYTATHSWIAASTAGSISGALGAGIGMYKWRAAGVGPFRDK